MSILNNSSALVVYEDSSSTNNPFQRYIDWRRNATNITVSDPLNQRLALAPSATATVFSGTRATAIDGTSAFAVTLNPAYSTVYRITNTGGTAPAFRTSRALTLSGATITVAVNNNATATFTTSTGSFSACQVGDVVFVPCVATGDSANIFSETNGGLWTVLAVSSTVLNLARLSGGLFEGVAEVVVLASNIQLQAFSSGGVQVGDTLEISAGFSSVSQKSFIVSAINPSWVEFSSSEALPLETGILPTASGMTFYSSAKRFLRIESDQELVVRFNGDTGNTNRITPRTVGDSNGFGWNEKWGNVWSLEIVNRSKSTAANVVVISAE